MNPAPIPAASPTLFDHALAAFLSPVFERRRVGVVGDSTGALARRVQSLGAASVVSFAAADGEPGTHPLEPGALAGFRGRLDVVLVPDGGSVPFETVIDEARSALGADGVLVVGASVAGAMGVFEPVGPAGLDYHTLHDQLARRFSTVVMVGRGAFAGYTFARFDATGDAVALDTRLVDGEAGEAEGYVAIASQHEQPVEAIGLIQVPASVPVVRAVAADAVPAVVEAVALPAPPRVRELDEYDRLEDELASRATELIRLRDQLAERDTAVRELIFALESAQEGDLARRLHEARERIAELSQLNAALASEAQGIVEQNDHLRERVALLDSTNERVQALADELENVRAMHATRTTLPEASNAETESLRAALRESSALVEMERARAGEAVQLWTELEHELGIQIATRASLEDRISQIGLELEGGRAGYARRVRELEHEVASLLQALEVVGAQSRDDDERTEHLAHELDTLRAERLGLSMRVTDADAALAARAAPSAVPTPAMISASNDDDRADRLLEDLSETASRLAGTEEALAAARDAVAVAERRCEEMEREIDTLRAARPRDGEAHGAAGASAAMVAQLEDRDQRLRALERKLIEEVEKARRSEGEIWEVELRARDNQLTSLRDEVARLRAEAGGVDERRALQSLVSDHEQQARRMRTALEAVRGTLSNILVDGRGAAVAHDIVSLLREIEDASSSDPR